MNTPSEDDDAGATRSGDGDDAHSIDFTRIASFEPLAAHTNSARPSSAFAAATTTALRSVNDDSVTMLPMVCDDNEPKTAAAIGGPGFRQLDDSPRARDFVRDPPALLVEQHRPPNELPFDSDAELRRYVGWERRRVADQQQLEAQPWYQFAANVAAYAGVSIDRLLVRPGSGTKRRRRSSNRPLPTIAPPVDLFGYAPSEPVPKKQRSSPPRSPRTPRRPKETPTRRVLFEKTRQKLLLPTSGTQMYDDAIRTIRQDANDIVQRTVVDDDELRDLELRLRAAEVLRATEPRTDTWLGDPATSGTWFLHPDLSGNERLAVTLLHTTYPRTLASVTADALERSESLSPFFALIVASLLSGGHFFGGKRPQRATDYGRYGGAYSFALLQFKFAHVDQRGRVEMRLSTVAAAHERRSARAPWCIDSPTSTRTTAAAATLGTTLKNAALQSGQFHPLAEADARHSPYGGRSVFI